MTRSEGSGEQRSTTGWSFARCRRAAAELRSAPFCDEVVAALRPRELTVLRSRAPLPMLLWVAARDRLLVDQGDGGYALLQRPMASRPNRSGRYWLRLM